MLGQRKSEARRWYQQAVYDLKAVRWNLEGRFFDTACFLAQQSAEKALKSLLYYLGARRSALMTHSLVTMLEEITKEVDSFRRMSGEARSLDLHYIPSRYPNGLPDGFPHQFYDRPMGEEAAEAAGRIVSAVEAIYREQDETGILN